MSAISRVKGPSCWGNDDRNGITHLDHFGITHPVRRQDDDLILGVEDAVQHIEEGLFGAGGDDHVFWGNQAVVVIFGVADDGFF